MSSRRFILITGYFKNPPDSDALEEALGKGLDWIQYASNCWLVWTSSSSDKWYGRFKPALKTGDRIFICELNIEKRSGWMPRSFWKFIQEHETETVSAET